MRQPTAEDSGMAKQESPLAGQVALVTGAAKRLGRAIAGGLAAEGVHVALHYRSSGSEAAAEADELRRAGVNAWTLQADLADPAAAEGLVGKACEAAGAPVDILVNSASIFSPSSVLEFSPGDLEANVQVNATSPLLLSRALACQGRPGQIVNLLDARIVEYDRAHAAYHLSKRMLFSLTRILALELAPRVRVNAVAPGLILPPPGEDESYLDAMAHGNPLRRHGTADDVVRATLFLLKSDFVTGQVIYVDGGQNLRGRTYGG